MSISPLGVIDFLIFLSLSLFIQWDTNGKSASFRTKVIPLCSLLRAAIRFFPNPLTSASLSSLTRLLPKGNASVSYTHLRAHETRHDLVCRLLLEKKKKKKTDKKKKKKKQ